MTKAVQATVAVRRTDRATIARAIVGLSGVAIAVVLFLILSTAYGHPGDIITYLAAGERLNAGHPLYALSPGDRPMPIVPPYWTVPLLSPPLIAVIWRPLALLPDAVSIGLWWIAMLALLGISITMILRAPKMIGAVAVYVLAVPLGLEAVQGNINAVILLGALVAWRAYVGGRAEVAGAIVAVLAVLKVTPAILVVWAVAVGGRKAVVGAAVGLAVAGAISVLGAGIDAHLAYLSVMRDTTTIGPSDQSLPGILRALGMPEFLVARVSLVTDVAGVVGVLASRGRPAASYRVAIVTLVAGSPVVYVNTFLLLIAALAPNLWPLRREPTERPLAPASASA
jgi:hypothetical protein